MDKHSVVSVKKYEDTNGKDAFNDTYGLHSIENYYFKDACEAALYFNRKCKEVRRMVLDKNPIIDGDTYIGTTYYVVYKDPDTKKYTMITVKFSE